MPRSRSSDDSAVSIRQRRLIVSCWPVRASSRPARMRLELSLTCTAALPVRDAMRRAILSGGRTAQASPASRTRAACPRRRSSPRPGRGPSRRRRPAGPRLRRRRGPCRSARRERARAEDAPTDASIGSTEGMQPLAHRPRTAHDGCRRRLERQMRVARRDEDAVGQAAACRPRRPAPRAERRRRAGARTPA
jgi:hypothetical protein